MANDRTSAINADLRRLRDRQRGIDEDIASADHLLRQGGGSVNPNNPMLREFHRERDDIQRRIDGLVAEREQLHETSNVPRPSGSSRRSSGVEGEGFTLSGRGSKPMPPMTSREIRRLRKDRERDRGRAERAAEREQEFQRQRIMSQGGATRVKTSAPNGPLRNAPIVAGTFEEEARTRAEQAREDAERAREQARQAREDARNARKGRGSKSTALTVFDVPPDTSGVFTPEVESEGKGSHRRDKQNPVVDGEFEPATGRTRQTRPAPSRSNVDSLAVEQEKTDRQRERFKQQRSLARQREHYQRARERRRARQQFTRNVNRAAASTVRGAVVASKQQKMAQANTGGKRTPPPSNGQPNEAALLVGAGILVIFGLLYL